VLDAELDRLTRTAAPKLVALFGVGSDSAGALLVAAGDNPDRLRSNACFSMLCGSSPIQASSGKTRRHRLNRGGDRQANAALYRIVVARLRHDQPTKDYLARRIGEGKSKKEAIRCLKRYVAREVFAVLPRGANPAGVIRDWRLDRHRSIHLVIGPGGVFVIDSKQYRGRLQLDTTGRLWHGRYPLAPTLRAVSFEADQAARVLPDPGLVVVPIVAVHGAQVPWGKVVVEGVPVVMARHLPSMLRQLPAVLGPERVTAVASQARIRFRAVA
jgi:hypothetical protein